MPKQNIDLELNNLEKILSKYSNINHISFYDLTVEQGCYFYKNLNFIPNNENKRMKYERLFIKLIKQFGFKKYEVSNYTKNNKYSIHNITYWKYKNYLGIGPAAHSKLENLRIENKPDLNSYNVFKDYKKEYQLSLKEQIEEYILMGLRLADGIKLKNFKLYFNMYFQDLFNETIKKYSDIKYIKINKNRIRITNRGLKILNTVLIDLFNELDKRF